MADFLNKLVNSGVNDNTNPIDRRSIVYSNYLSLLLILVNFILFLVIPQNYNAGGLIEMTIAIVIFSIPLLLNRHGWYTLCRLYLSWAPPLIITAYMIEGMREMSVIPTSSYDGLRYYLLGSGVIPFLLFGRKNLNHLAIAILPGFLTLLFCDTIFTLLGVGPEEFGAVDSGYYFTPIRSLVAYFVIAGSTLSLKILVENNDDRNAELVEALAEKNRMLQEKAESELSVANKKLKKNISELRKREFILNQSQRIAKMGSWEFQIEGSKIFWSDEMFNLFGLDKETDPKSLKFEELLDRNDAEIFTSATIELLRNKKPYDLTVRTNTPFGYSKWIRIYSFPVEKNGNVIGARGICHDITLYKESEELLKERENKYRSIFEQAFDPIVITDLKGTITDVNTSFCKTFGYEKFELIYKQVELLVDPQDLKKQPIRYNELMNNEQLLTNRKLIHRNNSIIDAEISARKFNEDRIVIILRDITEIRKARIQLEESETRFRTAFEFSAIGMALISVQGNFIKVNNELCRICGYSADELLMLPFSAITHPDDIDSDIELFNQTLQGKIDTYKKEKRYIHKNGSVVWVNISVSLVKDKGNKGSHFVTQIENITSRKQVELELIEAETKFRSLVEKSQVGVFILVNGKHKYVNPAYAQIFGYESEDIIEKMPSIDLVHPDDQKIILENERARLSPEKTNTQIQLRGIRKDGSVIWVESYDSRIPYQGDYAIIGTLIDITDRKKLEEEQMRLATIVSSSEDAIISTSHDGCIITWNRGAEKIFGYQLNEVVGKDISMLIPKADSKLKSLESIIELGVVMDQFEEQWLCKDNSLVELSVVISPLRDAHSNIVGATLVARDNTFRVKAEKAIRESEERYRILVENATEALVVFDVDEKKFINVSESAVELFKAPKEKLLNMSVDEISPEFQPDGSPSNEKSRQWITEACTNGKASFEWTHQDLTGKIIPCEVRLVKLPSEKLLVRGSIIDISDRIARDRDLKEANKKIGELKLMALRSVMSPHFIFNVLNSIQFYIAKNDRLNAINYLSKFSKLIRSVLTHSVDNKIKLSEEIELLRNYIELELTRFENKFDYVINIDEGVDTDTIEIPSLLIQPYVENAILHGLYNKKEKGLLTINIHDHDDTILFEIEDNGIGRKAATALKLKNFPTHKSMGINLTEERLQLINERHNVDFKVEDLEDEGTTGTRVTIGVNV